MYVDDAGGAFANWGACFEKAPGGSAACGEAIEKGDICASSRCAVDPAICEDETASDACVQTVFADETSCGQYDPTTACPDFNQADTACSDMVAAVRIVCGGASTGSPDAGTDGGNGSNDKPDDGSNSGSSEKKKKPSTGDEATPSESTTTSSSGCAQGPEGSGSGGSIASVLVVGAAVIAAASRRRSKQ